VISFPNVLEGANKYLLWYIYGFINNFRVVDNLSSFKIEDEERVSALSIFVFCNCFQVKSFK
jgi:hypothetical protein